MEEVRELNQKLKELEKEAAEFFRNCQAMQEYQNSLLQVCEIWTEWISNAKNLSQIESTLQQMPDSRK